MVSTKELKLFKLRSPVQLVPVIYGSTTSHCQPMPRLEVGRFGQRCAWCGVASGLRCGNDTHL